MQSKNVRGGGSCAQNSVTVTCETRGAGRVRDGLCCTIATRERRGHCEGETPSRQPAGCRRYWDAGGTTRCVSFGGPIGFQHGEVEAGLRTHAGRAD